ncbi:beta-ketoacyl-ACP synthase III [Allorhizobium sp. NPDC080224]|uniref:beta-ketoacyl-ACP synthase III n=1 Tax=Allorhizobium sp. NPDC080224 TaxID=3390547 RepID=UPI003D0145C3
MNVSSQMAGLGHYVPARCVDNIELETQLGLDPGWIERRTGIRSRRWAAIGETVTDMAVRAAEMALEEASVDRKTVALTLLATSTPDHLLPPSAPLLAYRLGLTNCGAFDVAGACTGFLNALALADSFVRAHGKPVLVVAANILSRRINMEERGSASVFGDAAGAILLLPSKTPDSGIIGVEFIQEGLHYDLIQVPAGGSAQPFEPGTDFSKLRMTMRDGQAVFVHAVRMMAKTAALVMQRSGLEAKNIDCFVPHQANSRMIDAVCDKLGISPAVTVRSIAEFGNSSAATIPLSLSLARKSAETASGGCILMAAAGAGMTSGAILWKHEA